MSHLTSSLNNHLCPKLRWVFGIDHMAPWESEVALSKVHGRPLNSWNLFSRLFLGRGKTPKSSRGKTWRRGVGSSIQARSSSRRRTIKYTLGSTHNTSSRRKTRLVRVTRPHEGGWPISSGSRDTEMQIT